VKEFKAPCADVLKIDVESRKGKKYTADFVRFRMIFRNLKEARSNLANHLKESRRVLMNAEVLILTLGLIEIWQSEKSGLVIGAHPVMNINFPLNSNLGQVNFLKILII